MNIADANSPPGFASRYPLLHRLSITILVAMLVTAMVLIFLYRQDQLGEHQKITAEENARILTHLIHDLDTPIHDLIVGGHTPQEISLIDVLFASALGQMDERDILKLKLYNMAGTTLYSSVATEIGGSSSRPEWLTQALHGETVHKMEFRDIFAAARGEMHDLHIVLTYMPLIHAGRQIGVIESAADVRPVYQHLRENTIRIALLISGVFSLLYAALFFAVFRADRAVFQLQRATADSEERLKFALEGAGDGAWDWNPQTDAALFSGRWKQMLGYADHEFANTGAAWLEHLHPDDKNRVISVVQDYFAGHETSYAVEFRMRCRDGSWKWILARGKLVDRDAGGKPLRMIGTHTDIDSRKQIEQALHESEKQAHVFAHQLDLQLSALNRHVIVATTDVTGRITYANDMFCEVSGYSRDELLGQDHILLNSGCHPHGFFKNIYRTITRGNVWHGEICNRHKNGELYWLYTTIVPDMGANHKPVQYMAIRTDITTRKKAEQAALAASRAKSEFLANMSHEIRTPMNGMIGMLDVLQQTRLNPDQQRMVGTIQHSSLALLSILNDILDLSKIEAGKLEVEYLPTLLRTVVEDAALLMYTSASAKSVELSVFVSPQLPRWIAADAAKMRQVLLNLLGNAVKFTSGTEGRTGKIALRAEPATLTDGRAGILLRISDNGIGMSSETLDKLFQPFTQADAGTSRKFGGTGLGLSISQRLVELMGGKISVRSILGEETEFAVALPLEERMPGKSDTPAPDLSGVRILIVTANALKAADLTSYCRSAGADVTTVFDLSAARQHLASCAVQIMLCGIDIDPGNELGLPAALRIVQLVRREQSHVATRAIPVSARPLLYHTLLNGLAIACGRIMTADKPNKPLPIRALPTQSTAQALADNRLILLAEDNETNRAVMREQLLLSGYAVEVAEDGVIALDMWRTGRYALLLTDCQMPHMDGFALTAAIRSEEAPGSRMPVIAVTANAMQGEAERCLSHGMDDYLAKPLRMDKLQAMLAHWLPLLPAAPAIKKNITVLIVEDDPLVAELLSSQLTDCHYEVLAVTGYGEQAVEQAQTQAPDVVLMDIMLAGDIDGIEAAQKIHQYCDIPVLFLTAYADDEFLQRAQVSEPYAYLLKPSTPREIQLAIEIALYRYQNERNARADLERAVVERTAELEQSRLKISEIMERISDAFISLDIDWRFTYVNTIGGEFFDRKPETLIGKHIWNEFPVSVTRPFYHAYHKAMAEQAAVVFETYDPTWQRWLESHIYPSRRGLSVFFHDITEHKTIERDQMLRRKQLEDQVRSSTTELNKARENAESANRTKSDFLLSNINHEIRTPMNGVIGMVEVLMHTNLEAGQKKMAQVIRDSAYLQLDILNDILDFSRIWTGNIDFSFECFAVQDFIARTCELFQDQAALKQVELSWQTDARIPAILKGDVLYLRQILGNFIRNAIKFSSEQERRGQVTLSAELAAEDPERVWLAFSVQDNGIGIDEVPQSRVLCGFEQADASTTRRDGGAGLGLAINHQLAALMGGEITLNSAPDAGSTFTLRIPLARADSARLPEEEIFDAQTLTAGANASPTREEALRQGQLILVAEDNETNREVIHAQLKLLGFFADFCCDGLEAYTRWLTEEYAIIISDLHMPHMDGYQLARAIRQHERQTGLGKTPIIALTATIVAREDEKLADLDSFLVKPASLPALQATLEKWLPAPAQPDLSIQPDETRPYPLSVWDETVLGRMVGDNPDRQRRLLEKFLIHAQSQVAAMTSESVSMDAMKEIAHSLKSSARTVGALQLGELCEALERQDACDCHALAAGIKSAFDAAAAQVNRKLIGSSEYE